MYLLYLDESGNWQTLTGKKNDETPVFVLGGFAIPVENQRSFTWEYIKIKKKFINFKEGSQLSEVITRELKGKQLRNAIRSKHTKESRYVFAFIDNLLTLLNESKAVIIAAIFPKELGLSYEDKKSYLGALRSVLKTFDSFLELKNDNGLVLLDSRTKTKNAPLIYSTVTAMFRSKQPDFKRLIETPMFGHSDCSIGLQCADNLVSTLLFPIACGSFFPSLKNNVHCNEAYSAFRSRYSKSLYEYFVVRLSDGKGKTISTIYCHGRKIVDFLEI